MSTALTINLYADTAIATLLRDVDDRWRWFDTTDEDESGVDMEISGDTATEALDALVSSHSASNIDGDLSDHYAAALVLDT